MEIFILSGGRMSERKRVSAPGMKNSSYRAIKFKTIYSMARIYILPGPVKPLEILHRPSEKFSDILKKGVPGQKEASWIQ